MSPSRNISPSLRRALTCLGAVLLGIVTLAAGSGDESAADPLTALTEGNRLFRNGQLEEAVDAYRSGYSPLAPHPTLLYNLGTALHHLDRIPEAILWYRRAIEVAGSEAAVDATEEAPVGRGDPWLQENLWLARRSLGAEVLPAGGSLGWLGQHGGTLRLTAIALAWLGLLLLIAAPRFPFWAVVVLGLGSASLYAGAAAVDRWGPKAAVLVEDCFTAAGELPAGTEAWVRPAATGGWTISGTTDAVCEADTVGLIRESHSSAD